MAVTATQLRADIYRLLDAVLETGEALEVERNGKILRIAPAEKRTLAELFPPRPGIIVGDPADLAEIDWSWTWSGPDFDFLIHVDTHVVIWLSTGELAHLPPLLARMLRADLPIRISPMVVVELSYLHAIGRLTEPPAALLEPVQARLDLRVSEMPFTMVAWRATTIAWTRNPFDRLIVASALAEDVPLYTADRKILEHCPLARWE